MSQPLVLGYHAVSADWPSPLAVTPDALRRQLALLVRRGFRGASFSEAVGGGSRGRRFAVTFDDAYLSVLELAKPILDELGLRGTVFVPTAFPESPAPMSWQGIEHWLDGPHAHELRPMSWSQLAELADHGWEVGSHSHTHARLPALDDDSLSVELTRSREICESRIGRPCASVAYPYGDWTSRVATETVAAGYGAACSMARRAGTSHALVWPRVGVYRSDGIGRFRLKVSRTQQLLSRVAGRGVRVPTESR